jgi:tetratricopeptide (TPR) repeat protein
VLEIVPGPEIAPAPPVPVPPGPPEWQRLANLGEFDNAWQALEKEGGFDAALAAASPEQIMLLVEIARFTRNRGRALQALRQLIKLHPDSPQAQDAAWVLANMLEQAGDRAGAAEAFALYQRLSPKGDLFEDSVVRQVELAIEQRDLDKARRLAEEHARKYPDSARLAEIRLGLERLAAAQEGIEDIELLPSDESEKLE